MSSETAAWQGAGDPFGAIKRCPCCGSLALEGEVECTTCDGGPFDDRQWREGTDGSKAKEQANEQAFVRMVEGAGPGCDDCDGRGYVAARSDRPFPGGLVGHKPCPECGDPDG